MAWRNDLVSHLASTLRVEDGAAQGMLKITMAWDKGSIDLPSVCNHLSRHFKIPSVVVVRRPVPGREPPSQGFVAVIRFADMTEAQTKELRHALTKDLYALAQIIVSSGT
jgi:hypothetical protein